MRPAAQWRFPEGGILPEIAATDTYGQFLVQYCEGDVVDANLSPSGTTCSTFLDEMDPWFLDEMFVKIGGIRKHLWRAVDQDGNVLDVLF